MKNIGKLVREEKWISEEEAYGKMVRDFVVTRLEFVGGVGSLTAGVYLLSQSLESVAGYISSGIGSWLLYDCYKRVKSWD